MRSGIPALPPAVDRTTSTPLAFTNGRPDQPSPERATFPGRPEWGLRSLHVAALGDALTHAAVSLQPDVASWQARVSCHSGPIPSLFNMGTEDAP